MTNTSVSMHTKINAEHPPITSPCFKTTRAHFYQEAAAHIVSTDRQQVNCLCIIYSLLQQFTKLSQQCEGALPS